MKFSGKRVQNMATCQSYLNFEPTENPKWRIKSKENDLQEIPGISKMISDILAYRMTYSSAVKNEKVGRQEKAKADRKLLIKYLLNIEEEENIGCKDAEKTGEIIKLIDTLDLDEKRLIKRHAPMDSGSKHDSVGSEYNKGKRIKTKAAVESENCQESNRNISSKIETSELPCYPSLGDTEDVISCTYESKAQISKPAKDVQETINLYRGYKHIAKEVYQINLEGEDITSYLGLMDVETFILQTHKIIMTEIMDYGHTGPGKFSTNERQASFHGVRHDYPHFQSEELATVAVQMLVDKYNDMVEEIHKCPENNGNKEENLNLSFKCSSLFLFAFLTLHPFGDGNGRLARLLCSYSLLTLSPFLTPIYNVFSSSVEDDYVQALVDARNGLKIPQMIATENEAKIVTERILRQKPSDLCALMIESHWSMWREYLHMLGIESINPYRWETGYYTQITQDIF